MNFLFGDFLGYLKKKQNKSVFRRLSRQDSNNNCVSLLWDLNKNGWPADNFLEGQSFKHIQDLIDAEMKSPTVLGAGVNVKQARALSEAMENKLWR